MTGGFTMAKKSHRYKCSMGISVEIKSKWYALAYLSFIPLFAIIFLAHSSEFDMSIEQGDGGFLYMLYFSCVTITTLGYGDIIPTTTFTRLLVSFESISKQISLSFWSSTRNPML